MLVDGVPRWKILEDRLCETTFFTDPASTKHHGAYEGGLAKHSHNMMVNLNELTRLLGLTWSDEDSPRIIALCHDICKIGAYLPNDEGGYYWNPCHPKGHGDLSVEIAKKWIPLTEEEEYCIKWHMGPYTPELTESPDLAKRIQECWKEYEKAIERWPNVLWAYTADNMAARFDDRRYNL